MIYTIDEISGICHNSQMHYNLRLGDYSYAPWNEMTDTEKELRIVGVEAVIARPDITPAESHQRWVEGKLRQGWTWGPVKDRRIRTHPCIAPWESLHITQRLKDIMFVQRVRMVMPFIRRTFYSVPVLP